MQIENSIEVEGKYLIALLRAAIRNEIAPAVPENLDWAQLFKLARAHMVGATVYRTVEQTSNCPDKLLLKWKKYADTALAKELMFDAERGEICREFDRAGIKYLPMKGIIIKNFYPRKGMRQFSDNDILFDKKYKKRVKEIMFNRGYVMDKFTSKHSEHDLYMKAPFFNFEMHRDLVNESAPYKKYFDKVWQRAIKDDGENCAWHMTDEDFYIYNLAHMHFHNNNNGVGIRFYCDLWLINKNIDVDQRKVANELVETGLFEFERLATSISESCFGDNQKNLDPKTFDLIMQHGVYGCVENQVKNAIETDGLLGFIFLPYSKMKLRFPFLKYLPFLLPFCWIVRLVAFPFSKRKLKKAWLAIKNTFNKDKS